jgi:protein-L-isoaspartate(D-aspartate) O-methyltransferase
LSFALAWLVPFWVTAVGQEAGPPDPFEAARNRLVETRIEAAGVKDPRILDVMRATRRHEFVPEPLRGQAYFDMALPIGDAQTISSPFIVAWMTEKLDPQPTDRVLEIGTGSGYQAAVLSPLVKDVYTFEIVPSLGERARRTLERLGYENVNVRVGDGFLGWPEAAPFDKIIVTCSPENIPQPLVDQLKEGGKLLIPVGERFQQSLYLKTKVDGKLVGGALQSTLFVPMTGRAEASRQVQPDPENPELLNGGFESPFPQDGSLPPGAVPGWYYERQAEVVRGDAFRGDHFIRFKNETPELAANLIQGLPIDGRAVTSIRVSGAIRTEEIKAGQYKDSLPTILLSLYDNQRREIETVVLGPARGSRPWRTMSRLVRVPPQAREGMIRIGLFGATGVADFDELKIEVVK